MKTQTAIAVAIAIGIMIAIAIMVFGPLFTLLWAGDDNARHDINAVIAASIEQQREIERDSVINGERFRMEHSFYVALQGEQE